MTGETLKARKARQMREYRARPWYREIIRERDREIARVKHARHKLAQPLPNDEDRERNRNAMRRYRTRHGATPEYFRDRLLKQKYGLEFGDLTRMLVEQAYQCAICKSAIDEVTRHVDHDHQTGVVRALLCGHCNRGLGQFRESPDLLDAATVYLRKHSRMPDRQKVSGDY